MKTIAIILHVLPFLVACGVEPEVRGELGDEHASDCCWYWPDTDAIDRCFAPFASPDRCEYLDCPLFDYSTPSVCPS